MKSIRNFALAVATIITAAALSSSCDRRGLDPINPTEEGQRTSMTFSVVTPNPSDIAVTKATDAQETEIQSLALLFYKGQDTKPTGIVEVSTFDAKREVSTTNYIYTFTLTDQLEGNNIKSGDYYLYAVANYKTAGFGHVELTDLMNVKLSELDSYLVSKASYAGANDIVMTENYLLLSGKFGRGDGKITLEPTEEGRTDQNVFTDDDNKRIHLRRITAKVSFEFINGKDVDFKPSSYSIYNYPVNSTLIERTGWVKKNNSADEINGTFVGSNIKTVNGLQYANIEDMPYNGPILFYMFENAQATSSITKYTEREERVSASDLTFKNAPEHATYIVVKGTYNGPLSSTDPTPVSGNVAFTIHLGNISTSGDNVGSNGNFTVRRNAKYNYKVTVNGVSGIVVDNTVPGIEGDLVSSTNATTDVLLDSHYSTVMVKIPVGTDYQKYDLISRTPKENITYISKNGGTQPSDVAWIKFVKPSSASAFPAYPGTDNTSMYTDVYGLISDINSKSGKYYMTSGGYYYTAAFVDEYYYSDLEFTKFVNAAAGNRELTLVGSGSAKVSADGRNSYAENALFSIKQKPMVTMFASTTEVPFGLEVDEETKDYEWSTNQSERDHANCNSKTNGYQNTIKFIGVGNNWNSYVASTNGYFDNEISEDIMTSSGSYAKYSCLSRNRDEDGDGKIDAEEIKWYLPARDQAQAIIYGRKALGANMPTSLSQDAPYQTHEASWYWASSSASDGGVEYNLIEMITYSYDQDASVRCVRTLNNDITKETSPVTKFDSSTNTVEIINLNDNAVRGSINSEYGPHFNDAEQNVFSKSFVFAKNDLSYTEVEGTLAAPVISSMSLYDYKPEQAHNAQGSLKISNALSEGYESIIIAGVSYSSQETYGNTLDLSKATNWSDDKLQIEVFGTKTIGNLSRTSNASSFSIKRAVSGQTNKQIIVPLGTVSMERDWNTYTITFSISNRPNPSYKYYYSTSRNGTQTEFSGTSFTITKDVGKNSSYSGTYYIWAEDADGDQSNPAKVTITLYGRNNSPNRSNSNWEGGNTKTYTTTNYSYTVNASSIAIGETITFTGSTKSKFSVSDMKTGTMCADYYHEDGDGGAIWRIPNQMELIAFFHNNVASFTSSKHYASKTKFQVDIKGDYHFINVFHTSGASLTSSSSGVYSYITNQGVSSSQVENYDYFDIRCVRDAQ